MQNIPRVHKAPIIAITVLLGWGAFSQRAKAEVSLASDVSLADTMIGKTPIRDPKFSFHFTLSPQGMGSAEFLIRGANPAMGKFVSNIAMGTQPLHFLGVWGGGAVMDAYIPFSKVGQGPSPMAYAFSLGGEIRYQARFWDRQPLVPSISYAFKRMTYRLLDGTLGGLPVQEPSVGLWLNLNWIDPVVAGNFRRDIGVQRTYLMVEYRRIISGVTEQTSDVVVSGDLLQAGLRFEF